MDRERRNKEIQEQEDLQNNKDAVAILMDVSRTLARQGLAFRGHSSDDGGEVDGNFYQIVHLVGRHSPIMVRRTTFETVSCNLHESKITK